MKPGKTQRKALEGKRRRYDEENHRRKPPADRQRGGGGARRSHEYPEYKTPSKQYESGPITYFEVIAGLPRPYHDT